MTSSVFLLWHVHHVANLDSGQAKHFESPDDFWADERAGDDVKLLGVYSSRERAVERTKSAATLDGFQAEPMCFHIDKYEVDQDHWTEGYVDAGAQDK